MSSDPRFCYVVLCHTDAATVLRLVARIRELSPGATIVVRHDRDGFITAEQVKAAGAVLLRSRIVIEWGSPTMVSATMEALGYASKISAADYFVLVSGHDYPVRHLAEWEREVVASESDVLLAEVREPEKYTYAYRWRGPLKPPLGRPYAVRFVGRIVWRCLAPFVRPVIVCHGPRDGRYWLGLRRVSLLWRPPQVRLVKGSQWMTLSRRAVALALAHDRQQPCLRAFLISMKIPDETYLQSILCADPRLRVVERPTTFARWPSAAHWSPVWLTVSDMAEAAASTAPFARKVGPDAASVRLIADALSEPRPSDH